MNKTVELNTTDECTRCAPEPAALDNNRVYMDGMMDDYSYDDDSYDDSYYDVTDTIDDVYELSSLQDAPETIDITGTSIEDSVLLNGTRNDDEITRQPPLIVDIIDETLEENNNDPNNNMDSIQMSFEAPPVVTAGELQEEPRVPSPLPGCSKDSILLPDEPPIEAMLIEQTRHVLGLVSRIHRDSVFEARQRDQHTPVSELRLWDLIPEAERLEFPDSITSSKKSKNVRNIVTNSVAQVTINPSNKTSTIKRGPDEDLCTIGCKRSSSTPDISLSVPMVKRSEIPKVPSTSQIPAPKIVPEPEKIGRDPEEHLSTTHAPVKVTDTPAAVSTPKAVRTTTTVGHGAIPKIQPEVSRNQVRGKVFQRPSAKPAPREDQPARCQPRTRPQEYQTHTQTQQNQFQPSATAPHPVNRLATDPVPHTQKLQKRKNRQKAQPTATALQPENRLATDPVPHTQQIEPAVEPTNRTVCMEIYYKLINIFPNVERAYVKRLCPPDWAPGDRDAQVASLVEMILEGGDTVPKIVVNDYEIREATDERTSSPDDIYENLLGIFPDADPHFLRDFAEKNAIGPDNLKQFVERNLEQRDYPTRDQYMARLKITEQQRQYTHGFDVKQYLSIIPDPAKHFKDPKRRCVYSTVAFEFLKSHFNKMRVTTISREYYYSRYNMSLTAEYLDLYGSDLKSKRWGMEMPTEDILLLQEIAYIKHKTEITDYIANAKKVEENEFKMLKVMLKGIGDTKISEPCETDPAQNLLLECQCCFDAECVPSKCCNCENGHIFCNDCVVNGTNAKLGDGDTHINCFINCGSEFSLSVLQSVLAPTTFSILLKKRQAAEVMEAGVEGLVSCPFCHFASIPPEGDKIFKCLNPECTKESCRLCKELSHVPLKCDEVMKADKARLYIEEKMTAALARTCYKCQKSFFKEEGCNKITCVCGAIMCYLCDEPIKDYSHFRGQGSDDQSRCPLYSDTIRLDAVAVRKVAEQAQLEVLKQNPNVKIDTRNLLPAIPLPQRGPHQDVLNADELPRRAQRVLDLPPM